MDTCTSSSIHSMCIYSLFFCLTSKFRKKKATCNMLMLIIILLYLVYRFAVQKYFLSKAKYYNNSALEKLNPANYYSCRLYIHVRRLVCTSSHVLVRSREGYYWRWLLLEVATNGIGRSIQTATLQERSWRSVDVHVMYTHSYCIA